MSSGNRESGNSPEAEGVRIRPQPPTLDLTATEVASDTPAGEQQVDASETAAPANMSETPDDTPPAEPVAEQAPDTPFLPDADERRARIEIETPAYGAKASYEPRAEASEFGGGYAQGLPPAPPPVSPWPGRLGIVALLLSLLAGAGGAWLWLTDAQLSRDDRTAALATRVGELEAQVRELTARPAPIPESRVAELAARTASADLALRQVRELETRVAKAEAALAAPRATGPSEAASPEQQTAVDTTLKSLSEALTDLRKRVEDNATATQVARDTAMQSSGATSAVAADVGGEIAALSKRIDALDATLKSVQAAEAAKPDRDRPARFASAALALRTAVERGEPYAAELAAAKNLVDDPAKLTPLEPFAASGLPSTDALARELAAVARTIAQPAPSGAQNTGMFDRLQASASKLVRVRPADETARESSGDPLAAAQAKAARGDLAGARVELGKLPESSRGSVEPWVKKSKARTNALELARGLARDGLDALGKR
jgi:hypothetical protein